MVVVIKKLKEQLMSRIDEEDLVQVEKVERYIGLVESFRRVSKTIEKEGESIVTENGAQRFTKAHPLIGERNKINASLLNIEKSFGFGIEEPEEIKRSVNDLI
ncbi:P27 family phage terminase small subunit [Rossellomorea vietnamensis]|uniref:P27 family phage terminase small subunit n=1 Tax=Rossellomorea vietnamensis TaxID=218284 RepID=A0A5D4KFR5_9BACI|nr:P27 family phage terminase small subunit [Rossellomorea vietnamensis]TYR75575.1 P27 family phage terminase small subunit [Rossellomorea vietnamensis]